jgi:AcrR family transcriptional regulator
MKTRERILQASLDVFNRYGAPNVTTNHIADELDISPGNLYYHFRNKDEIIYYLFLRFEQQISNALEAPESRALNMEDMWLYLHLVFESIWQYRFLYRDLDNILSRSRKLRMRFKRILERKIATSVTICKGLVKADVMNANSEEIEALAKNITLVATYWINFQNVRRNFQNVDITDNVDDTDGNHLGHGVFQVMALVSPFLRADMRALLKRLSHDYLD